MQCDEYTESENPNPQIIQQLGINETKNLTNVREIR